MSATGQDYDDLYAELQATRLELNRLAAHVKELELLARLADQAVESVRDTVPNLLRLNEEQGDRYERLVAKKDRALRAALATWCSSDPGGDGADGDTYRLVTEAIDQVWSQTDG